jgi:hypothetical protein
VIEINQRLRRTRGRRLRELVSEERSKVSGQEEAETIPYLRLWAEVIEGSSESELRKL